MRTLPGILVLLLLSSLTRAEEPAKGSILKKGQRVAIVGDSITEQKLYSKYIEAYLLAYSKMPNIKIFQFG